MRGRVERFMDSLYLLIPLSVVLVLAIAGILVWAVISGQFERLDDAGARALREEPDLPEEADRIDPRRSEGG